MLSKAVSVLLAFQMGEAEDSRDCTDIGPQDASHLKGGNLNIH
jgi:hypothetical protein